MRLMYLYKQRISLEYLFDKGGVFFVYRISRNEPKISRKVLRYLLERIKS